ncbi:S1 family peptidase [Streptomyces syringium]|uniref:S1 family peptidase n=1 Tax=Streptomyces syringium TaxID=76729 RepID=UPI003454A517
MQPSAPLRRVATLAVTALAVVAAVAITPHSTDASAAQGMTPVAADKLAQSLTPRLHGQQAGSYYDRAAKKLVVTVTTTEAATKVRKAGAVPRKVRYANKTLDATLATLNAGKPIPGTAWAHDVRANKILVTADRTVTGKKQDQLNTMLKPLGDTVQLERTDSEIKLHVRGGEKIANPGDPNAEQQVTIYCTTGFNVRRAGKPDAFLFSGHCGNVPDKRWYLPGRISDPQPLARVPAGTAGVSFPENDYAIAEYDNDTDHPSEISDGTEITAARDAVLNEAVTVYGAFSSRGEGTVTAVNATVNYPEGQVTGLIKTNVCVQEGDSGAPLYSGSDAIGMLSGAESPVDCDDGTTNSYFQPVVEALNAYGATVGWTTD